MKTILPPATIGVLGSGQLGRMLAIEARQIGYRVAVLSPASGTPTGAVADIEVDAAYDDLDAVRAFAQQCDVITYEFENVPAATAAACTEFAPLHPSQGVLAVAQDRINEKTTLSNAGLPVTPFRPISTLPALHQAISELGTPCILKTAQSGYDGKGQFRINSAEQAQTAWEAIGQVEAVLEAFVEFECEVSVVGARGQDGEFVHFGVIENEHVNHILDVSMAPSSVSKSVADEAIRVAAALFETLDVVGTLCVEFFVTKTGDVLINEIAPRPHNSGHLTIDGCVTSQFEQQLRAICGLPLGSTAFHAPTVMVNLLGDLWEQGEPNWAAALALPGVHLHLYGKAEARVGRKMGHLTVSAETPEAARTTALEARAKLRR